MSAFLIAFFVCIAAWVAQTGMIYQTGQQWYETCWTSIHAKREANTAQEAKAWRQCSPLAEESVFNAGYIFAGQPPITAPSKALADACPGSWSDLPLGGIHVLVVRLIEEQGGPTLIEGFQPAEQLIVRAFKTKWPKCPKARHDNGFPKLVRLGERWHFDGRCRPCAVEDVARETQRLP